MVETWESCSTRIKTMQKAKIKEKLAEKNLTIGKYLKQKLMEVLKNGESNGEKRQLDNNEGVSESRDRADQEYNPRNINKSIENEWFWQ